mmetsp:Transcript_7902/g.13345  ORF Transcript_7902/g.13345 Transcript_7902/m.13345 type:complete len:279 (-) Transcript_7902:147-983(-)
MSDIRKRNEASSFSWLRIFTPYKQAQFVVSAMNILEKTNLEDAIENVNALNTSDDEQHRNSGMEYDLGGTGAGSSSFGSFGPQITICDYQCDETSCDLEEAVARIKESPAGMNMNAIELYSARSVFRVIDQNQKYFHSGLVAGYILTPNLALRNRMCADGDVHVIYKSKLATIIESAAKDHLRVMTPMLLNGVVDLGCNIILSVALFRAGYRYIRHRSSFTPGRFTKGVVMVSFASIGYKYWKKDEWMEQLRQQGSIFAPMLEDTSKPPTTPAPPPSS